MVEASYAFTVGLQATRESFARWQRRPLPVVGRWALGSLSTAAFMLVAVWIVSMLDSSAAAPVPMLPPFVVGGWGDVISLLEHNGLVLALHSLACLAGFIAGSSLPLQAGDRTGVSRWVHLHGGRIAIGFVVAATTFSLTVQTWVLGHSLARISGNLSVSPGLILIGVLPHAVLELTALFLPLAAWILASRRGAWDELLAATIVTTAIAIPMLVVAAIVEVYVSPHVFQAVTGAHIVYYTIRP